MAITITSYACRSRLSVLAAGLALVGLAGFPAIAQDGAVKRPSTDQTLAAPPPADGTLGSSMQRISGVWIEGPGFEITYGGDYAACSKRCLGNAKCAMIEYYRPEKKCNLYDRVRPQLKGGSSDVAIRR